MSQEMAQFADLLAAAAKGVDGYEWVMFAIDQDITGRRCVGKLQIYHCRDDRTREQLESSTRIFRWMLQPAVEENLDATMWLPPTRHCFLNLMLTDCGLLPHACASVLTECPGGVYEAWSKLLRLRDFVSAGGLCRTLPPSESEKNLFRHMRRVYGI